MLALLHLNIKYECGHVVCNSVITMMLIKCFKWHREINTEKWIDHRGLGSHTWVGQYYDRIVYIRWLTAIVDGDDIMMWQTIVWLAPPKQSKMTSQSCALWHHLVYPFKKKYSIILLLSTLHSIGYECDWRICFVLCMAFSQWNNERNRIPSQNAIWIA